jgi:sugar phosphate isomerase/epimerase
MGPAELAAWLDSYPLSVKDALHAAAADGFRAITANVARGDLDPRELTRSARRHLSRYLRDLGLRLGSIAVEWPDLGLADPRHSDQRADQLRLALELCADLGVTRAAVTLAGFGSEAHRPRALEMLGVVAGLADRFDVAVAVQGGTDDPGGAVEPIRALACPGLRLGIDTACLPADAQQMAPLAGLAGSAFLRDVRRVGAQLEETPFGQGQVDFPVVLALLEAGGYAGPLIVRRAAPAVDALRQGREYIAALMNRPIRR